MGRAKRPAGLVLLGTLIISVTATAAYSAWIRMNPSAIIEVGSVPLEPGEKLPRLVLAPVAESVPPHVETSARRPVDAGGIPRYSEPSVRGVWPPDGKPPGPALPFRDPVDDSGGLQFVLLLGTDARSGNPANSRADSIHILALDPKARKGTIVGIPRDSWVEIPGKGRRKINDATATGGPELAVKTVRQLTGIPVTYYMITAFEGFRAMVNALGGMDGFVPYNMNDANSGAFFQKGWHRMDGEKALAFSRNRHIPGGDLGRSENQGRIMLDALKKLRAETSTRAEVEAWLEILTRHTRVSMPFGDLVKLALLARTTASSDVANVVAPGRSASAGRASVVMLTDAAFALFRDVADDAVVDGSFAGFGPQSPAGEAPGEEGGGGATAPIPPPPAQGPNPSPEQHPPVPAPSPEPAGDNPFLDNLLAPAPGRH